MNINIILDYHIMFIKMAINYIEVIWSALNCKYQSCSEMLSLVAQLCYNEYAA